MVLLSMQAGFHQYRTVGIHFQNLSRPWYLLHVFRNQFDAAVYSFACCFADVGIIPRILIAEIDVFMPRFRPADDHDLAGKVPGHERNQFPEILERPLLDRVAGPRMNRDDPPRRVEPEFPDDLGRHPLRETQTQRLILGRRTH